MLIETPLQYSRKFIPDAYQDKIYCGLITGKGSVTTLQDDFLANVWTPDNTLTHNSDKTFNCNDSAVVALTSGAFPAIAVDEDILAVSVYKVQATTGEQLHLIGNVGAGSGFNARNSMDYDGGTGVGAIVRDGVTQVVVTQSRTDDTNDPNIGDTVVSVCAWDRDTGVYSYFYNITQDVVIDDSQTLTVANAGFTPDSQVRLTLMDNVYCSLNFTFASGGLPSTWKADVLELANNVITLKD